MKKALTGQKNANSQMKAANPVRMKQIDGALNNLAKF